MRILMIAIMAFCSMMITACGDDKIENEQNNKVSAKSENTDTKGEESEEEKDSMIVGFESEGWDVTEKDTIDFG